MAPNMDPTQPIANQLPFVPQFNASISPFTMMHPPFTAPPWNNWQALAPNDPSKMFNDSKIDPKILASATECGWTEHRVRIHACSIAGSMTICIFYLGTGRSSILLQRFAWWKHLGTSTAIERLGRGPHAISSADKSSSTTSAAHDDDAR